MAHAEDTIVIDRPVQKVFNYVLDGMNGPLWRTSVLDVKLASGKAMTEGAVYQQGLKGPTGRVDGDYQLVEVKPNESIKFQVITGPARPKGTYLFQADGKSTRITFILDFQPRGLGKLMDGAINKSMQAEVGMLSNLKKVLESSPI